MRLSLCVINFFYTVFLTLHISANIQLATKCQHTKLIYLIPSIAVLAIKRRVGKFHLKSFKIWEYRYDEEQNQILYLQGNVMDVYSPLLVPRYSNRPNCFTRSRIDAPLKSRGKICTIKQVSLAVIGVLSSTDSAPEKEKPQSFWEIVRNWGQTWLWDNLVISGDIEWIAEAIRESTLVAVTDESYMEDRYHFLNSAAFIVECSRGSERLMGSFIEYTPDACAYSGVLLGVRVNGYSSYSLGHRQFPQRHHWLSSHLVGLPGCTEKVENVGT